MKKLVFMFVAVAAISFASCGNGQKAEANADSLAADTTVVDTTAQDSAAADTAAADTTVADTAQAK